MDFNELSPIDKLRQIDAALSQLFKFQSVTSIENMTLVVHIANGIQAVISELETSEDKLNKADPESDAKA